MESRRRSLRDQFPHRHDVTILLGFALLLLPFGLVLPTLTLSKVGGLSESTYSVVTGIIDLARSGNLLLAIVILTFSFLFPIVKLTALWLIWLKRMDPDLRARTLHNLKVLGKWSMLDVFFVAVFVGAIQFGFLATATPRFGVYLFAGAVVLSMIATVLQFRLARLKEDGAITRGIPSLAALPSAVLSLLFLSAGLSLPLMEVQKWVFWNREYSVMAATKAMVIEGKYLLAFIVVLFVVVIPFATLIGQICLVLLRRAKERSGKLVAFLEFLNKWTMVDVFALGMLIVVVKIGDIADVSPQIGLTCFMGGVLLSMFTTWLIKA